MMTSEIPRTDDLDALVAALAGREMVVVAPHGTVNTGLVTGGQRQIVSTATEGGATTGPMRQGPVRAKYLKTVRRRFVPPPCFKDALTALDSGIAVLLGEPGTGRETHALNLLAHGNEEPVLVQVDGAVNLSRWGPRAQGVHGYLVMEPPDPFALRAWDLSRLEALLAEAGAHLVIVLADAPGLAGTLEDHLGIPVLRHCPPDPRKVFSAHLSDGCSDEEACARWLRALEPGQLDELLPEGLPPRQAAQAAEAVSRLGVGGGASGAEVLRHLAQAEASEAVARALADPALLAHLLSITVYGGLHRSIVLERAGDFLRLAASGEKRDPVARSAHGYSADDTCQRPSHETLRLLGAHRVQRAGEETADTVSFFRPAVSDAMWEVLCRDHTDLVPLLHTWLAGSDHETDQVERAGRAVAAMAVATGGQSMELLRDLASTPSLSAPEVAAWCLGTAVHDPATARTVADLLEQWSIASEAPLRKAVAYACHSDRGQVAEEQALRLLQRLMETSADDPDDLSVLTIIATALVQRFEAGGSRARATILRRMYDWAESDGVPSLLAALTFPLMAGTDLAWWSDRIRTDAELASSAVQLAGHALNESIAFADMRDVLLVWCSEADGAEHRARALSELLDGLVAARQPGFLRWLLAVERGPDAMPGKKSAARALTVWRRNTPAENTD
ncbi:MULTISPECIES: hypothetical protein [Streptomyces]|uniref:hypothetical protein n=1 Tax=Streptomyces TaxID=1883 RepID=UPI0004CD0EE1|nr:MULTISPECIES: hypothetical protein [Streptomyces]KOT60077.1 hypothetical protein ADK43_15715 [Streptomyces rimosus subsp. rimosus]